ncbi:MAG: WD40 repeat domain-containing protein [Chloroflexota bacterium]
MTQQNPITSPYVGLEPYTEERAAYFFGRDRETALIADNLEAQRLTLLYGPSGVGKSSVLRAGVMYTFTQRAQRDVDAGEPPAIIPIYFNRWQQDPLRGLEQTIIAAVQPYIDSLSNIDNSNTDNSNTGILPDTGRQPVLLEHLQFWSRQTDSDLVLILDQFEEYFQYRDNYPAPAVDGGDFATQLIRIINHGTLRTNVLISLREDALSRLDFFKGRIPTLLDNRLSIGHLKRTAAETAIREPLQVFNNEPFHQPQQVAYDIEDALVTDILDQVGSGVVTLRQQREPQGVEAGSVSVSTATTVDQIQTPYLQLVLTKLWDEERKQSSQTLRQTTLDALGGAEKIVRNYLDDTLNALGDKDRQLATHFFDRLVTPSGTKIALSVDDLVAYTDADPQTVTTLVRELQDRRLLNGVRSPSGVIQYELAHDVLGQALLDWQEREQEKERLVAEERRFAEEEEARKKAERQVRQGRLILAGVSFLLLLAMVATGWALMERRGAEQARRVTEAALRQALTENLSGQTQLLLYREQRPGDQSLILARDAVLSTLWHDGSVAPNAYTALSNATTSSRWIRTLPASDRRHQGPIYSTAFSPDGSLVVSGGSDKTIRLWDAQTLEPMNILYGHTSSVLSVGFSPDGRRIVSGSSDQTVRIWDADSGEQLAQLDGHTQRVLSVGFSPDGRRIVSGDGSKFLWRLDPDNNIVPVTSGGRGSIIIWDAPQRLLLRAVKRISRFEPTLSTTERRQFGIADNINLPRLGQLRPLMVQAEALHVAEQGKAVARTGALDEANAHFAQAIHLDPTIQLNPTLAEQVFRNAVQAHLFAGRQAAQSGELDAALVELEAAIALDAVQPPTLNADSLRTEAQTTVLILEGNALANEANFDDSLAKFEEAVTLDNTLSLDDLASTAFFAAGELLIHDDAYADAVEAYRRLQTYRNLQTYERSYDLVSPFNTLCQDGILDDAVVVVLPICEEAVMLAPGDSAAYDNRGLARALIGDVNGAIEDFQAFIRWAEWSNTRRDVALRQAWIAALEAGEDVATVFSEEVLARLRNE